MLRRLLRRALPPAALLLTLIALLAAAPAAAFQDGPMPGWEKGSPYNRLYDPAKRQTIKGTMVRYFDVLPLEGMAPGLGGLLRARDGRELTVHFGPKRFIDFLPQVIEPGAPVKLRGAMATVSGLPVFMAAKVRKAEVFEIKLRATRSGSPSWDLTDRERFEETLEQ